MSVATPAFDTAPGVRCCTAMPQRRRLRQDDLTDTDRNVAVAMHLSPLAGLVFGPFVLVPLVLWLVRRDDSAFNDDHGREMVNALLSFFLYNFIAVITLIGVIMLPVLYIVGIVNLVRGAVAAGRGEYFRYPMTIRFLS